MTDVFVAEIAGRAIIALNADHQEAALRVLEDPAVKFDLQQFHAGGKSLWNGIDPITVRAPTEAEFAVWDAAFRDALVRNGSDYEAAVQETWICVLVAVTDPHQVSETSFSPLPPGA